MHQIIKKGQQKVIERVYTVKKTARGKKVVATDRPIIPDVGENPVPPPRKCGRLLSQPTEHVQAQKLIQSPSPKRQRKQLVSAALK